jgi:predicted DsbA family dithiol-disulfide isomerase
MTGARALIVDLVSDPVCPWCYVGLRSLLAAAPKLAEDFQLLIRLRPYFLNPDHPKEGVDRAAHYRLKFPDTERLGAAREMIRATARASGFDFDPAAPTWLPNTLDAHRVILWAQAEGRQLDAAIAVCGAYWQSGVDIGDKDRLADVARAAGLDADQVRRRLDSAENVAEVRNEARRFAMAGVTGVPTFIVNERVGFSGGMTPDKLEAAIREAASRSLPFPSPVETIQ